MSNNEIINLDDNILYENIRNDVENIIKNLLLNCPLFGDILINVSRSVTNDEKITAYVTPKLNMVIGIPFWNKLSFDEKTFVLVHECMHLINNHFERFSFIFDSICKESDNIIDNIKNNIKMKQLNIALDVAINQIIPYGVILNDSVTMDFFNSIVTEPAQSNMCSEYYWQHIQKYIKKNENLDGIGNHFNNFFDLSESDICKLNDIISKAKLRQKEFEKNCGKNPGEMEEKIIIDKTINTNEKLWKCFVNRFVGNVYTNFDYQYGKKSRRDINSDFGKVKNYENGHKIVVLDTSGSVDSFTLTKLISHINAAIKKMDVTLDIIQCDAKITVTKNVKNLQSEYKVIGRGGTDLTLALKYISENYKGKKDIIVMTDGETPWWTEEQIKHNLMDIVALYSEKHSKLCGVKYEMTI